MMLMPLIIEDQAPHHHKQATLKELDTHQDLDIRNNLGTYWRQDTHSIRKDLDTHQFLNLGIQLHLGPHYFKLVQ